MQEKRVEIIKLMAKTKSGQMAADKRFATTPPRLTKRGQVPVKASTHKALKENKGKQLPKGPGLYGRPDAREEEEAENEDEERMGNKDDGPVAQGYASDDDQYNVVRQGPEPTQTGQLVGGDLPLLGTYGRMSQSKARDCEGKVIL